MPRLFVRVYLAFCLAMLISALTFLALAMAVRRDPLPSHWAVIAGGSLFVGEQEAVAIYEQGEPAKASLYLQQIAQAMRLELYLFDDQARSLGPESGSPSREITLLTRHAQASLQSGQSILLPLRLMAAFVVQGKATGRRYVLVARLPGGVASNLWVPALRLLGALGSAALICYLFTRSLTNPILVVRQGARRLASGDMTTRVSDAPTLRRRRDEIGALGSDLDRMAERLESMMQAQMRLLADVSHELRSPLARIQVALALAQSRSVEGKEITNPLERIEREAHRMDDLIGQLLTLARLENQAPAEESVINLTRLVRDVVRDADYEARGQSRQCVAVLPEAQTPQVRGESELLHRALDNVVRNAIRHTAENTAVAITLSSPSSPRTATITVRDHGPGVPADALSDLFRPFWRVSEARDRATGGTGLGLAIADRVIRQHGGTIAAENVPDGGLLVTITLSTV